jgi:uncharacterized membrane protein YcaP (DUF421 family)
MSFEDLFGSGRDLDALQMGMRAFVLFFVMLALLRLSGMRAFGRKSSFDAVVAITLGAVLSRVIVGASPAVPTIVAATVLAGMHRIVAVVAATVPTIERLVKGASHWIYRGGIFNLHRMHVAGISKADVEEAVRKRGHADTLRDVREVRLEANGELTVVM